MEDVTWFKLVSIGCIWLVGFGGGLFPVLLATKRRHNLLVQRSFSLLNAFSGGVFLAGGFLHLLHAALDNAALRKWSTQDDGKYAFPYAELFCTCGFLGVFLLELAANAQLTVRPSGSGISSSSSSSSSSTTTTNPATSRGNQDMMMMMVEELDPEEEDSRRSSFYDPLDEQETKAMLPSSSSSSSSSSSDPDHHKSRLGHDHHSSHAQSGHGHSHGMPNGGGASSAVAMVLFIALSFHSVMEGLGIGAQDHSAWGVFLAIVVHKGLAAFALGSELAQTSLPNGLVMLYMVVFSFMSILGIFIGWAVSTASASTEDSAAAGICVALASGTFIYVAVMEVIPQEFRDQRDHPLLAAKATALCVGYMVFGLLAIWT